MSKHGSQSSKENYVLSNSSIHDENSVENVRNVIYNRNMKSNSVI